MSKSREHHKTNVGMCALVGHVTYEPVEDALAARLSVVTVQGVAWRCLRCGDYVLGQPVGRGPADEAPIVPRGRMLRDLWIMRALAIEKSVKAFFLFLFAFAVWRFEGMQASFQQVLDKELPLLQPAAAAVNWDMDKSWIIESLKGIADTPQTMFPLIIAGLILYALVELGEAVGLFIGQRWGEYFAVVATSFLIPLEVYEIVHHVTWFKVVVLVINLFLVVWLIVEKRLFGIRGGHAAYVAEHHEESLLTIERATIAK